MTYSATIATVRRVVRGDSEQPQIAVMGGANQNRKGAEICPRGPYVVPEFFYVLSMYL